MSSVLSNCDAKQRRVQSMVRSWSGQGAIEINVAIVGSLGVGKSALTVKYITKRFISEYDPDLEDIYSKNEAIDQKDVVLNLMDTCDMPDKEPERYLSWGDAFLVVYSITNRKSFDMAQNYLEGIHQRLSSSSSSSSWDTPTILVGNKVDMERYRQVSKAEGSALASHFDSAFFETTAAEDYDCVARVFHEVIREVLREHERSMPLRPLFISEDRSNYNQRNLKHHVTFQKDQNLQEKNSKFKFFNRGKGFKAIFQSAT
ncbi:Ras-like protein member 12 [Chamberlinius hualienensis]